MKSASLLLVDDDRRVLESMADWLRSLGYRVDVAASYGTALAALEKKKNYEIVLTDIRLGDGDGFDLLAWCRQNVPQTSVILLTGYGTVESAVEAIHAGAFDFLTKPLIDEELEMAIERGWPSAPCWRKTSISRPSSTAASAWKTSSARTTGCRRCST